MQYPMRFLYILLMFIAMNSYMQEPPKKVVLNGDVTRLIERMHLGKTAQPKSLFAAIEGHTTTDYWNRNYHASANWNSLHIDTADQIQESRCIMRQDCTMTTLENLKNKIRLLILSDTSSHNHFTKPLPSTIRFDGPNEEQTILIYKNLLGGVAYNASYYLAKFNTGAIVIPDRAKPLDRLDSISPVFSNGYRTQAIALASKKLFAVATFLPGTSLSRYLSWYRYNQNLKTNLAKRVEIKESLQKIAFLVNSTLLGLSKDGSIIMYWLTQNSEIRSAKQKLPFRVIDFAVDPINKGLVAFAISRNGVKIALADIFYRDAHGKILFQVLHSYCIPDNDRDIRQFSFYDNTISYVGASENHIYLHKIHPRTRFKPAAIKAPIE